MKLKTSWQFFYYSCNTSSLFHYLSFSAPRILSVYACFVAASPGIIETVDSIPELLSLVRHFRPDPSLLCILFNLLHPVHGTFVHATMHTSCIKILRYISIHFYSLWLVVNWHRTVYGVSTDIELRPIVNYYICNTHTQKKQENLKIKMKTKNTPSQDTPIVSWSERTRVGPERLDNKV